MLYEMEVIKCTLKQWEQEYTHIRRSAALTTDVNAARRGIMSTKGVHPVFHYSQQLEVGVC